MNIIPVANNLYRVTDVFPQEIIDFCKTANWNNYQWRNFSNDFNDPRKVLELHTCKPLQKLYSISKDLYYEIQEKLQIKFLKSDVEFIGFWLDKKGFKSPIHRDFHPNEIKEKGYFEIPISMQIYLSENNTELGTKFYYDYEKTKPKYFFPYEINTGYLQINDWDQWHEMINEIGENEFRLSCQVIFPIFTK